MKDSRRKELLDIVKRIEDNDRDILAEMAEIIISAREKV